MAFRIIFRSTQQVDRTGGWGEQFWNSQTDQGRALDDAKTLGAALIIIKGNTTIVPSVRISSYTPPRRVKPYSGAPFGPRAPLPGWGSDYPNTALRLKLTCGTGQWTQQWIRGIPDAIVVNGLYAPGNLPFWSSIINAFLASLKNSTWQIRVLTQSADVHLATAFDPVLGLLTYTGPALGADGAYVRVRVSRFTSPSAVNKVWTAKCIAGPPQQLQLSYWAPLPSGTLVTGNSPIVTLQAYTLQTITDAEIVAATSHYTGKPTGLLGGKKRKRKKIGV